MSRLTLGPLLRYAGPSQATIWAEVDRAGTVGVKLGDRELSARTFGVEGHHFALVELEGLEPGDRRAYTVTVDGEPVWPPPGYQLPRALRSRRRRPNSRMPASSSARAGSRFRTVRHMCSTRTSTGWATGSMRCERTP